ncbi:uncharacterized protein LOC117316247 [Pecten maximus]|uniref:uncharacterized protein LOC117316247 n=1 Tax=Pecten maximus TaxID=6579 RepID=UPI001457F4A2|nr:uncharacterized protein LOC117316247 [Pecten maximus]
MADRFASLSVDEKDRIFNNADAANTKRVTTTAVRVFREYLTSKSLSAEFETYEISELDEALANFYLEMRNKNGELYKKSTLLSYRHGIQRHLELTREVNIMKGEQFKKSVKAFKSMTKELKRQGYGAVDHYPAINEEDLAKLYDFLTSSQDVQLLQYKVGYNIFQK